MSEAPETSAMSDSGRQITGAPADESPRPGLGSRLTRVGLRTRILAAFIGLLALATLATVLVADAVLYSRVDQRIDEDLDQEASELRSLAGGVDPSTGLPFGTDVRGLFDTYFERNTPSRGEVVLTLVDGEAYLRSRQVESYRLDEDQELTALWRSLSESRRGSVETPGGPVEYLAIPLKDGDRVLGTFVVAQFRELQQEPFDDAVIATGAVGLAVLLIGSLLAWLMAEGVLRPVRSLSHAAQSISETDLTQRIEVRGRDELAELARTFNAMLDRLEVAFASQRRFIDDVGHELRTPITIIRGHLELVEDDPAERAATLAIVMDELDRMSRIVNDLLLLVKAEQPDFLRLETVDVAALTTELSTKAQALAPRAWMLEDSGQGLVVADRQRLTQALVQLASNAAGHTREGDTIALGCSVAGGEARFWVRDEGSGIAAADQAVIFERFARRTTGGQSEGAGLGLSIVRAIAEAHGGRVELDSAPGAGAAFTVVVPVEGPRSAMVGT
jgi:signal transduction histidine kinase